MRLDISPDMDSGQQAVIEENNGYLNELETMAVDLNVLAPSLAVIPNPKPGNSSCLYLLGFTGL